MNETELANYAWKDAENAKKKDSDVPAPVRAIDSVGGGGRNDAEKPPALRGCA
jgi:hypothetical protein